MPNLRKLAAIDILFLGPKCIIGEFALAVFFSPALGLFVLLRGRSVWQWALGVYLICLGLNYIPMLVYAISIGNRQRAETELAGELADKRSAVAKYRRQSLLLLLPLVVPILALARRPRSAASL